MLGPALGSVAVSARAVCAAAASARAALSLAELRPKAGTVLQPRL